MVEYVGLIVKHEALVFRVDECGAEKLGMRLHVRSHSPTGFGWGYIGSGPAQLALAILCDVMIDTQAALALYQRFKFQVILGLHRPMWRLHQEEVEAWIISQIHTRQPITVVSHDSQEGELCL